MLLVIFNESMLLPQSLTISRVDRSLSVISLISPEIILFSITEVSISGGRFMVAVVIPVKKQAR